MSLSLPDVRSLAEHIGHAGSSAARLRRTDSLRARTNAARSANQTLQCRKFLSTRRQSRRKITPRLRQAVNGISSAWLSNATHRLSATAVCSLEIYWPGQLEVAIGLETVHPQRFRNSSTNVSPSPISKTQQTLFKEPRHGFACFFAPETSVSHRIRRRSSGPNVRIDLAFDSDAGVCCIIPTRAGNGAMEDPDCASGDYAPPTLRSLETVQEYGLSLRRGRVFGDLWDLEKFYTCGCSPQSCGAAGRDEPNAESAN